MYFCYSLVTFIASGESCQTGPQRESLLKRNANCKIDQKTLQHVKARSLSLQFMSVYPSSCVRAIPYPSKPINSYDPPEISVCLYMHTNGKGITDDHRKTADKMFAGYKVEFFELEHEPLGEYVTSRSGSDKTKIADLAKLVEENLHIFENRLNVMGVQPSYKIVKAQETNELCVTVFVLGKGRIPVGEQDFSEVEQLKPGYPFDIVEGYYVLSSNPFLSSESPSHFGVGIGVEGCEGAGTLGAFLTDEDGKWYLLSCQHVIGKGSSDKPIIVQPAEDDYKKEKEELEVNIGKVKKYIEDLESSLKDVMDARSCEKKEKDLKKGKDYLKREENKMQDLEGDGKPRAIATYSFGLQKNFQYREKSFFVDAAIAEISEIEREDIESGVEKGTVYGFKTSRKPINGTIVKLDELEDGPSHSWKAGRTTRDTEVKFYSKALHLNQGGYKRYQCDGYFKDIPLPFCHTCANKITQHDSDDCKTIETSLLENTECASCGAQIFSGNNDNKDLWACNCFLVYGKEDRRTGGDSGSVIFDNDGRAWGMIFASFGNEHRLFSVASPIEVVIEAFKKEYNKNLRLLCIAPPS